MSSNFTAEERPVHIVEIGLGWESGYTLRTHQLALAQRELGMTPTVVVKPSPTLDPYDEVLSGGVAVSWRDGIRYFHRTEPRTLFRAWIRATQYLRARQVRGWARFGRHFVLPADPWAGFVEPLARHLSPTIVHAHTPPSLLSPARRLAARLGVPTVYEVRGFWELSTESRAAARAPEEMSNPEWRRRDLLAANDAHAVITLSVTMREELVRRGVAKDKIHIIGNGVDARAFAPPTQKDPRLVVEHDLVGRFVLGYATNVRRMEGIETVLRAMRELKLERPTITFVLLGDGPDLERLTGLRDKWQLHDQLRLVGRVPHSEVRRYYSLFDAFVVPRTNDEVCRIVTPLKPLEAMAMGIPVLASDLPALRELVEPGTSGTLFSPDDPDDLARAIVEVLENPARTREIALRARRWVQRERDWRHLAAKTSDVYETAREAVRS